MGIFVCLCQFINQSSLPQSTAFCQPVQGEVECFIKSRRGQPACQWSIWLGCVSTGSPQARWALIWVHLSILRAVVWLLFIFWIFILASGDPLSHGSIVYIREQLLAVRNTQVLSVDRRDIPMDIQREQRRGFRESEWDAKRDKDSSNQAYRLSSTGM